MSRAVRKITGIARRLAQAAAHLEAVDVGQADVEDDEPRPMIADRAQRVVAGRGLHDAEALAAQVQLDEVGDVRLVVDDEDCSPLHMTSIVASGSRPET